MKLLDSSLIILLALGTLVGCATSETGTTHHEDMTLKQHLMQKGNLKITSDRGHIYFTHVTGGSTAINSDGLPLYVIDGLKVGSSFERASEMVQRGNIKSVRVLSPGESTRYGSRGGHGVILVETIRESQ